MEAQMNRGHLVDAYGSPSATGGTVHRVNSSPELLMRNQKAIQVGSTATWSGRHRREVFRLEGVHRSLWRDPGDCD